MSPEAYRATSQSLPIRGYDQGCWALGQSDPLLGSGPSSCSWHILLGGVGRGIRVERGSGVTEGVSSTSDVGVGRMLVGGG